MKIKYLVILSTIFLFLFVFLDNVNAQETSFTLSESLIDGENIVLKDYQINIEVIKKEAQELESIILKKPTQANVVESYTVENKTGQDYNILMPISDSSFKLISSIQLKFDGKAYESTIVEKESRRFLSWDFSNEATSAKAIIKIEIAYSVEAAEDKILSLDMINIGLDEDTGASKSAENPILNVKFPFNINEKTFSGLESEVSNSISNKYSLNQNNQSISWDLKISENNGSQFVKFLPERINTKLIESDLTLSTNPSSFEGNLKRIKALCEIILMKDRSQIDLSNNAIYQEIKTKLETYYRADQNNPQTIQLYVFALTHIIGDGSNDKFINELLSLAIGRDPKNQQNLETKYFFQSLQRNGNFNKDYLPFQQNQNNAVFFLSPKFNYFENKYEQANWKNSLEFNANRAATIEELREFARNSSTSVNNLQNLIAASEAHEYNRLFILTSYIESVILGKVETNLAQKESDVNLNLKNYDAASYSKISEKIANYVDSSAFNYKPLPQLILNQYDNERFPSLIDFDAIIQSENSGNNTNTQTSNKIKSTNDYYMEWFNSEISIIAGLLFFTLILIILFVKSGVSIFYLFGSASRGVRTFANPRSKIKDKNITPLLDKDGDLVGQPYLEAKDNPLATPGGLMD